MIGSEALESYDRYMNVQGMLKKKHFKLPENPQEEKQKLRLMLKKQ